MALKVESLDCLVHFEEDGDSSKRKYDCLQLLGIWFSAKY